MPTTLNRTSEDTSDREILISRTLDAPRELVWHAMTDPKHVANWWGPKGFTTTTHHMDLRPGGIWKHTMHGPDGTNYPNKSIFKEVVRPERIVYSHGGGREDGPGATFIATWRFEAVSPMQTKLTIHMVFPSAADRDHVVKEFGAIEGGKQTLGRLAEYLPEMGGPDHEFVLVRELAAPRTLVWDVWTKAEHLQRWFGPKGFTMPDCSLELRPGGVFHYGMRTPDGHPMWCKWTFKEIVPPEKLVVIVSFSDAERGITRHPMNATWPLQTLSTMTLTEHGDRTTLTLRWTPYEATPEEQQTFEAGQDSMNQGWSGTFEQLNAYLAQVQNR